MRWLLWKDYRVNRMILGMAIFLLVVPHLMVTVGVLNTAPETRAHDEIPNLAIGLIVSAAWSVGLLQLTLAFLGGNVIAGERFDRSAEFLAYLPVSRRQILASKLLVVLGFLALVWLPNLLVVALASRGQTLTGTLASDALVPLRVLPFIGSVVFGVAWLFSASGRSPVLAVCLGVLAPLVPFFVLLGLCYFRLFDYLPSAVVLKSDRDARLWYDGLCLAMAVVCFAVGTLGYLRRVEP